MKALSEGIKLPVQNSDCGQIKYPQVAQYNRYMTTAKDDPQQFRDLLIIYSSFSPCIYLVGVHAIYLVSGCDAPHSEA